MTDLTATPRVPRYHRSTPMHVVSNQVITTDWAQGLITLAMPILQEMYRKALEIKRAEAEQGSFPHLPVSGHVGEGLQDIEEGNGTAIGTSGSEALYVRVTSVCSGNGRGDGCASAPANHPAHPASERVTDAYDGARVDAGSTEGDHRVAGQSGAHHGLYPRTGTGE